MLSRHVWKSLRGVRPPCWCVKSSWWRRCWSSPQVQEEVFSPIVLERHFCDEEAQLVFSQYKMFSWFNFSLSSEPLLLSITNALPLGCHPHSARYWIYSIANTGLWEPTEGGFGGFFSFAHPLPHSSFSLPPCKVEVETNKQKGRFVVVLVDFIVLFTE